VKYSMKDFHDGIEIMLRDDTLRTVTVFCSPLSNVKQRIRISRQCYSRYNDVRKGTLVVSYGNPNYAEREYLKLCKKAKCNPRRLWLKHKAK
jgi:hypothetical protein